MEIGVLQGGIEQTGYCANEVVFILGDAQYWLFKSGFTILNPMKYVLMYLEANQCNIYVDF